MLHMFSFFIAEKETDHEKQKISREFAEIKIIHYTTE